ncbi:MAG: GNAT family N-acetyltransferase [Pseudomonadota bacterium]
MTLYETEWVRQKSRTDVPEGHLPVHRWYLRHDNPTSLPKPAPPQPALTIMRAVRPTINFYRFLYHTVGEDYLWGDRRRMDDATLMADVHQETTHVMVLYRDGVPAGFYQLDYAPKPRKKSDPAATEIAYFGLLPGFTGGGLGSYMLSCAVEQAAMAAKPVTLNTCTLDHPVALQNYLKRGFAIIDEDDEFYPDPRLDGTIIPTAAQQVPTVAELKKARLAI